MAALLIGGAYLTVEKVREKRAEKRAKKIQNEERYADLHRETFGDEASITPEKERAYQPKLTDTATGRRSSTEGRWSRFKKSSTGRPAESFDHPQRSATEHEGTSTHYRGSKETSYGVAAEERRLSEEESDREGGEKVREAERREHSASGSSASNPVQPPVRRMTTGEMLFNGGGK